MKSLSLLLNVPILVLLLTSCDVTSTNVQSTEQLQAVDNTVHNNEEAISIRASVKKDNVKVEDYPSPEWEPRIIKTPVSQPHKPFCLPTSNAKKIRAYFYNNIDINRVKEKKIDESDNFFSGHVLYNNDTSIIYFFDKEQERYLGEKFVLSGNYVLSKSFSEFHKDIIYKMLEVSGAENPKQFFQELIDSSEITEYEGCTVQQKQAKYGMIDLTSCIDDDMTVLSLYNPELE